MDRLRGLLFACAFEDSEEGVASLDAGRAIRTWTRGAERLLGIPREEALGRDFARLFASEEEGLRLLAAARASGLLRNAAAAMVCKDGTRATVFLTARLLREGAEEVGTLVSLQPAVVDFDVDPEHKAIQQALIQMERFSAVGRMTAAFAHEMRTPLHVICSTTEFALEFQRPEAQLRDSLEMILRNAQHATLSIKALLDFAKLGRSQLREGSLNEVVSAAVRLIEKTCEGQSVAVELSLGKLPAMLLDPHHMRAVVHTLLINAVEAMPSGGRLCVRTEAPTDQDIHLLVRDTGTGMEPEVLAKASAPFFTTKEAGTGLGLYLAKRVLAEHGAVLSISSRRGEGTEVTVHFRK